MTPIVFINCKREPFVSLIISGQKQYETRTRNMLGRFLGERILIAETGNGKPVVRCSARITGTIATYVSEAWERYRARACIRSGSSYDWQDGTRVKWLYKLEDVQPVDPFTPPEGRRHGRTWMEYKEAEKV